MKRSLITLSILLISLNYLFAQSSDIDANRVRQNIRALERKIEQIAILSERYQNDRAQLLINKSKDEFLLAQNLLAEWAKLSRPRPAQKLIEARAHYILSNSLADQASRLLLFKPAADLKTELERLIIRAESVVHNKNTNEIRYFLNKARTFHQESLNAFRKSSYLKGHEYLKIAIYFAEKTISLATSNQDDTNHLKKLEEQRNNILVLLNQVSNSISDNPVLSELYQNAQNYIKRALTAYNNGNLNGAYSHLQIAERLVYRIIDLSENSNNSSEDRIKDDFQSLGRYLNSVRNELESQGQSSKLLDRADKIYSEAGKNISRGQFEKAAGNLKLSQRMGMRAFNKISSDRQPGQENLQNRIKEIQRLTKLQENRIAENETNSLKSLHNQAVKFLNQAEQAFINKKYRQASYLLNLSLRVLNRTEKLIGSIQTAQISPKKIEDDLIRIEQIFTRLTNNPSLQDQEKVKVNYLSELLKKARQEYQSNNLAFTREILFIIQHQLSTMLKN
ncbi:MAG: hypothetical protein D8M58_15295 [Calditrichaeota bacterium]|nr:MAG: hypothetical protein DWQ03_16535 [Calditrichota bacterium]MBL1206768.1 hypothetical protein [Calditrichota bacterium]NOG46594.1 hypothetical protein [Calditrichota bacterium]